MFSRKLLAAAIAGSLVAPTMVAADPIEFDFYGSLRLQYEAVNPNDVSSYDGFRDAYSRIGFNANAPLAAGVSAFAQLELPLDLANGAVQDPSNYDEDIRVARIGLNTDFGTFIYGQDWMPYYNAITFPIDMFSTYYSGFGTYTSFRLGDSVIYYSPDFNGFSFAAAYSNNRGYGKSDGRPDDRWQLTGTYGFGDTTISAGIDDVGGAENWRFYGLSLMHTIDNLYIGAKIEYIDSDQDTRGFGRDGDTAANLFVGYTMGQTTLKGMIADVDGFGGTIWHLGVDYDYNDRLTLFGEYYDEHEAAAISAFKARDGSPSSAGTGGGSAFAVGARYSF